MKVLSVIPKDYQKDGQTKTLYNVVLVKADGSKIGATSFEPIKKGDEIADDRVKPGKPEGEWVIWSEKKPGKSGGSWQRNDDLIVAQCAAKMVVDLVIAGKINPLKIEEYQVNFINFARAIKATEAAIKVSAPNGSAAPAKAPPAKAEPPGALIFGIKNMGELRKVTREAYPTLGTTAAQDGIWGDPKLITDFDAAFKKIVDYMEQPI
jgi:hypothetical protein